MRVVQLLLALCVSTSIGLAQVTVDTARKSLLFQSHATMLHFGLSMK